MAEEMQEGKKTVVAFVVGLLIGGILVWAFSGPAVSAPQAEPRDTAAEEGEEATADEETTTPSDSEATTSAPAPVATLPVGEGRVTVTNQAAGNRVALASATYPVSEGWIGVRDYQNGQLAGLLGVVRFSEEQGLVPSEIILQRPTTAGAEYAVVVYTENGDRTFSLADDVQIDSIFATFTAQ